MGSSQTPRPTRALAVLLASAIAFSACSSKGSDSSTSATGGADTGAAAASGATAVSGTFPDSGTDAAAATTFAAVSATGDKVIPAALADAGPFSTLISALTGAGLDERLSGKGPFTLFAPSNAAFAKLPTEVLAKLLLPENRATLKQVLSYHVVGGLMPASGIRESDSDSLEGAKIHFALKNGAPTVNGATIVAKDIAAANGVIHGIDSVLVPPDVDLNALPGTLPSVEPTAVPAAGASLLQTLADEHDFTKLLAAIDSTGMKNMLEGQGPFTIFAPSDDAFGRLPTDTLRKLLLPQNHDALTAVVKHHVTGARMNGRDLKNGGDITMLDGTSVKVKIDQGRISVGEAKMTLADQDATNGVMHVIDAVLVPPGVDPATLPG
jgi:transforming growth factor-beta-induced protein